MSPVDVTSVSAPDGCPSCGSVSHTAFYSKNGYHIVCCSICNLLHVSPTPTDGEILAHYQDPAYFGGNEEQGYRKYADMEKALRPHFLRRLNTLSNRAPTRGVLLDFGCAAGYFLKLARAERWQIAGVELSQDMAAQAAQLLDAPIAPTLAELSPQLFDAITLWEVIEHLPHPVVTLSEIKTRLRPGGVLMLSTPNNGHWQAVRAKERWIGYRPPSHLNYFTSATLLDMLSRVGFEDISIHKAAPLPPLPAWLDHVTTGLQLGLANGQARNWRLALYTWRAIRALAWVWQKLAHPGDDIFTTLEAIAVKPSTERVAGAGAQHS